MSILDLYTIMVSCCAFLKASTFSKNRPINFGSLLFTPSTTNTNQFIWEGACQRGFMVVCVSFPISLLRREAKSGLAQSVAPGKAAFLLSFLSHLIRRRIICLKRNKRVTISHGDKTVCQIMGHLRNINGFSNSV